MSMPVDREQLRRDLSDALKAIQRADDVTGLAALAGILTTLEENPYGFHGRLTRASLSLTPTPYSALIWSLVQVISKLEQETWKQRGWVTQDNYAKDHSNSPRRCRPLHCRRPGWEPVAR